MKLILCALMLIASAAAQQLQFASLGDFKLESGQTLRDCRIGYRTFGTLNSEKSNAVLIPTWAGGTTEQLMSSVGPQGLVDPAKYYVILADALSNGVSSSPSNSKLQPRMQFPKITIRDMVNTQHQLLTQFLHIPHVHAVMGISMGGMQTFQWMVAYPDFMDVAVPIVGSPRLAPYDLLLWQLEIDAIESDAGWNHGDYKENPSRAVQFEIGDLVLSTPERYNSEHKREDVLASIQKAVSEPGQDANNHIHQAQAMMALDVSAPFAGSMERAAAAVKAKVLVVVSPEDHTVTPQPAIDFAKLLHAELLEVDSPCGHLTSACESQKIDQRVRDFLGE
ncbi:MAG TPA: alpha/beta fold hydrolase [Candidatus Sulfotelmatobacter sp.]|nr:alpha/beta fold hydrolase [Terriglobales bacterium]HKT87955.1 alpha/beta fold hydrolase [Candidatus Sulfotelmatobacter sp.]